MVDNVSTWLQRFNHMRSDAVVDEVVAAAKSSQASLCALCAAAVRLRGYNALCDRLSEEERDYVEYWAEVFESAVAKEARAFESVRAYYDGLFKHLIKSDGRAWVFGAGHARYDERGALIVELPYYYSSQSESEAGQMSSLTMTLLEASGRWKRRNGCAS